MPPGKGPGRPRQPEIDASILEAARAVFTERGFHEASVMEIARRAKVGTPAVYRRWKSKEALATTIVTSGLETEVRDTGDLRRDLIRWLRGRAEATHDDAYVHLLLTIAGIASRDPDTAALLRRAFESSREPLAARLEAAVARGELPPDVDTSLVQDLLQGAMHLPRIYSQQRRTEPDLERIADAVLRAVGPAPKARRS